MNEKRKKWIEAVLLYSTTLLLLFRSRALLNFFLKFHGRADFLHDCRRTDAWDVSPSCNYSVQPTQRNVPLCNQNDAVLVPLWTLQSVKRAYRHAHKNKLTTHRRSVGSGIIQGTASTGELRYTVLGREVPELARSTVYTLLLLLLSFFRL